MQQEKITKKQRRLLRQQGVTSSTQFRVRQVTPLTHNQRIAFDAFNKNKHIVLHGSAGTGKTFIALYLALNQVEIDNRYEKVVIIRSVVPSREIGFLPGSHRDKVKVYELPYYTVCEQLYGRGDGYEVLKQKQRIEFVSTSFMRGLTLSNCIVIIDECQNMAWHELNTCFTRIGENCRVIICGDTKQSDLLDNTKHDLAKLLRVCKNMKSFEFVQMTVNDIVRSGFCKEFLIQCDNLGY